MSGVDAPGTHAPAELPPQASEASVALRTMLVARGEPAPVVILLDVEVRSGGG